MTLTGDPRRWANEPGLVGVVRYPDTHRWGEAEPRPVAESLQGLEDVIRYEGAAHDRGDLPRDDRRHERHPHPARRLHPGRPRDLRPPRHPDGRRRGHGRLRADRPLVRASTTGTSCPDLMTMAKGLTRSYLPLGAVAMRHAHRRGVRDEDVLRRPHVQLATRSASPRRWRRSASTRRTTSSATRRGSGRVMRRHHERLAAKHPCVGAHPQHRAVRDHRPRPEPRPVDADDAVQRHRDEMKAIGKFFRENGLYTLIAEQLDPHEPAAVHHRGAARRGLRRSSTRARHRRPGGHRR